MTLSIFLFLVLLLIILILNSGFTVRFPDFDMHKVVNFEEVKFTWYCLPLLLLLPFRCQYFLMRT